MKFKFRFASVLKLRRHQEKKEKQKLGILLKKKEILHRKILELKNLCHHGIEQAEEQSLVKNRQDYAQKHTWHKKLTRLRQQVTRLDTEVEEQRQALTEAYKNTRMMEKLKDNEKQAFIEEAEHLEQLQQNEIAIQRYNTEY